MSIPDPSKLNAVGQAMVVAAPDGWRFLKLEVMAAGEMTDTGLEIETQDGSIDIDAVLELDGLDAVEVLRAAMYEQGKGTWYLATITIDENGQIRADFDYENPPFGGIHDKTPGSGHADSDLLLEDHKKFLRDQELLPEWHPARRAARP
ncbi:hypothetical protein CLV30_101101 [Haloactinopolyspora alba]|uniref:DUF600 family protein n=1 Tax=Haloactinopolyspora alba TaxID=648780 RepID=A0A2P8EFC0_9ACTN|nr:hypothetical protein [Haloactinopolyspora alba]PSL08134.1 hypothetical protein CLV30_101101 [Haloactinopolyspora alba]